MAVTRALLVGIAMSTLVSFGTVSAQQSGGPQDDATMRQSAVRGGQQGEQISPGEVRTYFRQVENQINQAVQSGNAQRLHQWTQANIADGASFQAVVQMGGQSGGLGGSKEIRILSFNKNDMMRRQQAALSLAPEFLNRIENYDLGIRVQSIQLVGDSAAVVKTRISESGTIGVNAPGRQLGEGEGTQTQGMGPGRRRSLGGGQDQAQENAQNEGRVAGQEGWNEGQNEHGQGGLGSSGGRFQQRMGQMNEQTGQRQEQTGQRQVSFNADAECTQLVQRDPNSGHLTIGLSNCNAEMQF